MPAASPLVGLPKVGMVKGERERWLAPAELWRFWRATEPEGPQGEALRFMVLTAARVTEATELVRSELDFATRTWVLPAARHKAVRNRVTPLSPQALALLARCPRLEGEERVFGGFDLTPVINRVRERMGGETWEPRDLRRTAATLLAGLGVDESTISRILGHAQPDKSVPKITGVYVRWDYRERVREALDRLGAWVEDTVTRTTEPGDVVSIEARR
jgi:integrase